MAKCAIIYDLISISFSLGAELVKDELGVVPGMIRNHSEYIHLNINLLNLNSTQRDFYMNQALIFKYLRCAASADSR